jgi:hypothetical protein
MCVRAPSRRTSSTPGGCYLGDSGSVLNHPLLDRLDSALGDVVPRESVRFAGEWSRSMRRTYRPDNRAGTGTGPFVDVVDVRWRGAITSGGAISGIAFLVTAENLYWVKAPNAAMTLPVEISLHAYDGYRGEAATFTAGMAGAWLPGVPVRAATDLASACLLGPGLLTTGRVTCLARADSTAFVVLLLPRAVLKVGRNHLWRMRDERTASLPADIRELLTRRRTGIVRPRSPSIAS